MKKILSIFISFLILTLLTSISSIFIARIILSGDNLSQIMNIAFEAESSNGSYADYILNNIDPNAPKVSEYVDTEKMVDVVGDYMSEYIKYSSGVNNTKKPNIDEIKNLLLDYCDEYEKATGKKIDTEIIDEVMNNLDEEMGKLKVEDQNSEITKLFNLIYSDNLLYILIGLTILMLIILYLINKDMLSILNYISTSCLLNGVSIVTLGFFVSQAVTTMNNKSVPLSTTIAKIFYKVGFTSIGIGVIFIIIRIVLKKQNLNLQEKNTEI